jgi:DNA-binding HxlR family transcriptional regulator
VKNKANSSEENKEDHSRSSDNIYSESRGNSASQQVLLVDNTNDDESSASSSATLNELHSNDSKILSVLKGNTNGEPSYTFNGLVRELNIHQQSLSRSLKRLVDLGLIEQIKHYGFRLTNMGRRLGFATISENSNGKDARRRYIQLAQLHMHFTKLNIDSLASKLTGRWFENLRWVGKIEDSAFSILKWKKYDNSFGIKATIMHASLIIESDAVSEKEIVEAVRIIPKIIGMVTDSIKEEFISHDPTKKNLAMSRLYPYVNKTRYN